MKLVLFLFYIIVVTSLSSALRLLERKVALPGYGQ
jgi:ABC-type amino acid transport system permease subunit